MGVDFAQRLKRVAEILSQQDDDLDAKAVADGFSAYLCGDVVTLDDALGVRTLPGQRKLATQIWNAKRNALLCKAACDHFPNVCTLKQARELHRVMDRYFTSAWRHERHNAVCPPHLSGTVQAAAWEILKLVDRVLSERRIREILATS